MIPAIFIAVTVLISSTSSSSFAAEMASSNIVRIPGTRVFSAVRFNFEKGRAVPASPLCKDLFLIRHAEGIHNEAEREARRLGTYPVSAEVLLESNSGSKFHDPPLTAKGEGQCLALRDELDSKRLEVDLVVTSPFRRTLETAFASLPQLPPQKEGRAALAPESLDVAVLATDLVRERVAEYTCDGRRSIRGHADVEYPGVDFGLVEDEDPLFGSAELGEDFPSGCAEARGGCPRVFRRAEEFVRWLGTRSEQKIAVVSHQHFMAELVRVLLDEDDTRFKNAEMAGVQLCELSDAEL